MERVGAVSNPIVGSDEATSMWQQPREAATAPSP
jgi:hypothetical protein